MSNKLLSGLKLANGTAGFYDAVYRTFLASCFIAASASNRINAPFGRFSQRNSMLNINANLGWFIMEIVSPITFCVALLGKPFSNDPSSLRTDWSTPQEALDRLQQLSKPTQLMAALFVIHYINRSTISSLRTPKARSPMHISVMLSAILFNLANGYLLGSWLGGRTHPSLITINQGALAPSAFENPIFWSGIAIWFIGFIGNIYHDEILYSLRRPTANGKPRARYSIPHGGLYNYISFPSYTCEWVEWFGFALACSSTLSMPPALPETSFQTIVAQDVNSFLLYLQGIFHYLWTLAHNASTFVPPPKESLDSPLLHWKTYITPPWCFLYAELCTMIPRALNGQKWYRLNFEGYPKDRKVVIPGLF